MLLAAYAGYVDVPQCPKSIHNHGVGYEIARQLYEGLDMPAEVPLHYYYNYEQTLGATAIDPLYMSPSPSISTRGLNTRRSGISLKRIPTARDFWSQFR